MQTLWIANGDFEAASRKALLAEMADYSVENDDTIIVTRLIELTPEGDEVFHDAIEFEDELRNAAGALKHKCDEEDDYIREVSSPYLSGRV